MSFEADADGQRLCYICLDPTMVLSDDEWVHPCRCIGTMAWVHKRCILRWVRIQNAHSCPQCLTPYHITPPKSSLILAMEFIGNTIYPCVKVGVGFLVSTLTVEIACLGLGLFAFVQVYGANETFKMLSSSSHDDNFVKLHLMTYSLVAVSAVPWEDYLLRAMRYLARIPVLGLFLPANPSRRTILLRTKPSVSRTIARSVTLPIYGRICGDLVFNNVHCRLTRVILGGLSYVAVKGGLYMYYTQKLMTRLDQIDVLPYEPETEPPDQNNTQEEFQDQKPEPDTQKQSIVPTQQSSNGISPENESGALGGLEDIQERSEQDMIAQGTSQGNSQLVKQTIIKQPEPENSSDTQLQ